MVPGLGRTVASGEAMIGGAFVLTDQDGKPRSSADFRGRYQLIYFGYSFCPDVCPTTLAVDGGGAGQAGRRSEPHRAHLHHHTIPARDTPAVLKKYMAAFGPRFVGLTGTAEEIVAVEKEYRVYAKKQPQADGNYGMDHSSVIYLMGPNGKLVRFYDGVASPEELAKDLKQRI